MEGKMSHFLVASYINRNSSILINIVVETLDILEFLDQRFIVIKLHNMLILLSI
jgi:hypothetical protein